MVSATDKRKPSFELPFLSESFPENDLTARLRNLFRQTESEAAAERDQAYGQLSDHLSEDPQTLVHVLLAANFEGLRASEAYLTAIAYGFFLLDRLDTAAALCDSIYAGGGRQPFLVDLIVRILIESGDRDAAQSVIAENQDLLDRHVPLLGRTAALLYLDGRLDEANLLSERIHSLFHKQTREQVNQRMDDILLLDETKRRKFDPQVLDGYTTAESQRKSWLQYEREMGGGQTRFQNDSAFVNYAFFAGIRRVLDDHPGVETAINYGSLFGISDFQLAQSYPGRSIVGYDRAPVARELNEPVFKAPNLQFLDGDFAEAVTPFLQSEASVLGHCRTGTLMYPEDLTRFYRTCHGLGIDHLVIGEYTNYGEVDGHFPDFATSNRPSTLLGGHMIQHDYGYYLSRSGYRTVRQTFHPMTCHRPHGSHGKVYSEIFQVIEAERRS